MYIDNHIIENCYSVAHIVARQKGVWRNEHFDLELVTSIMPSVLMFYAQ